MNVERHSTAHAPVQRRLLPPTWRHYAIGAALSLLCAAGLLYLAGLANENLRDTLQTPLAPPTARAAHDAAGGSGAGTGAGSGTGGGAAAQTGAATGINHGADASSIRTETPAAAAAAATTAATGATAARAGTTAPPASAATGTAGASAPASALSPAAPGAPPAAAPAANAGAAGGSTASAAAPAARAPGSALPPPDDSVASLARELRERRLTLPVSGITAGQLASGSFAEGRPGHPHEALDILAPHGTPIVAVEDGRVAKLFWSKAGGHTIYQFDPTNRAAYYYAHLDRYAAGLTEGQTIRRGDIIGFVGSTGNADPKTPHLHFAIFALTPERQWWKGTAIDPYPVLQGPRAASPPSP